MLTALAVVVIVLVSSFYLGSYDIQRGGLTEYAKPLVTAQTVRDIITKGTEPPQDRMVVYNGYISLETGDIQGVLTKIRALADAYGGYVAGSSRSTYGMQAVAEITIRVPKDKFNAALREIEGYGKILDQRSTSEDVTERYIDLKARLENLERQEKRLHEILGMARTVDEVLKVEKELERVRGQIESLRGQLNYLERNVAMSLIAVRMIEPASPFTPPGMDWGEVIKTALRGLFTVLRGLIILAVAALPLEVIAAAAYLFYRRKKRKEKKTVLTQETKH
jgi:hypothetical protein